MFTPDLDLVIKQRCQKFCIQDKTGVDTGDEDKWSGVSGLDPATLSLAEIDIVSPAGVTSTTDVLSQIPSPVTGTWWFNDMTGTQEDGLHNIVYRLRTTDKAITEFVNYNSTVANTVKVVSSGHSMVTGMYVNIYGSENYNGEKYVTRIDDNNYYVTSSFLGNDGACTGTIGYRSVFYPYVFCKSEASVDKMYANLARMAHNKDRDKYLEDANTAKGLLQVLKSAISSSNIDALEYIQEEMDRITDYHDVDPNI